MNTKQALPKPIVRWPGGKTRLLKNILPLFRPHRTYVEAFGGGLAVLLAKERAKCEVVNDINGDLVSLYRCAQFHLEALISEIQWTLNSREELDALIEQPGLTEIQRAARFFLRNRLSFGGGGTSFAVSKTNGQPSRENVIENLRNLSLRLDKVAVERLSYERLMKLYDSPETCWFFDPPYTVGAVDAYQAWDGAAMAAFANHVQALDGDWLVTVNDCAENRELFGRHEVIPVVTQSGAVNRRLRPGATFGELIIRRRRGRVAVAVHVPMAKAA